MAEQSEEAWFRERGFGLKLGFGAKPVLLVVDIANAFTDPASPLGSNLDAQVEQSNRLIDAAHDSRVPVIFTTVWYEEEGERDGGIFARKQSGAKHLRAGTRAVDLDARLLSYGADTLVICGCSTSGCVRAIAVDACQNGFRPMVVREAVGDRSKAAHEQSLFDLHTRYADVVGMEETLGYLKGLARK